MHQVRLPVCYMSGNARFRCDYACCGLALGLLQSAWSEVGGAVAVLDNLVKGAAGQAMQNLNIMMGQPEETALMQQAMFP